MNDKTWRVFDGLLALIVAGIAHDRHLYVASIPLAVLSIIFLGSVFKETLWTK